MPKVEIWNDERYPDYGLTVLDERHRFGGTAVEISEAELSEYKSVSAAYDAMQTKLREWERRPMVTNGER